MARAPVKAAAAAQDLTFLWEGVDKRGKRVKGELRAPNDGIVKGELRKQGIVVGRVKKKPKPLLGDFGQKITSRDLMLFTRQLSTMLNSGVPVVQSLDMLVTGAKNLKLRELIREIKTDVESGLPLATALGKHPLQFDNLYCNLVNAGEEAGVLDGILNKIAIYQEKAESIKAKVKKALLYPTIVLVVAFIVTAFIMIFVIPQFESLFKGFGADLPAFTKMVVEISRFFQAWWWAIFGSIIGTVVGLIEYHKRSKAFREFLDRISLKMPILGDIFALSANARFARTLATMFGGGVPLVDAMRSVAGATGNIVYERAVLDMRDAVASGQQLNFTMRQTALFPDMVVQMVAIGEEAGSLSDMLAKVADFYEEELDNKIGMLTTLIEPLVMALLAGIVGSLVIAMYLPIFKMGSVV